MRHHFESPWVSKLALDSETATGFGDGAGDGAVEGIPKKSGMDTSVGFAVGVRVEILVEFSNGERLKFSGTLRRDY